MKLYGKINDLAVAGESIPKGEDGAFDLPEHMAHLAPELMEAFGLTAEAVEPTGDPDGGDDDPSQFMVQLAKKNKAEIAAYLLEAYEIEVDPDKHRKDDLLDMVVEAAAKAADAARLAELQAKAPEELTPEEAEELAALLPQDEGKE